MPRRIFSSYLETVSSQSGAGQWREAVQCARTVSGDSPLETLRGLAFLPPSKKVSKEVGLRGTPSVRAPALLKECRFLTINRYRARQGTHEDRPDCARPGSPLRIPFPHWGRKAKCFCSCLTEIRTLHRSTVILSERSESKDLPLPLWSF